MSVYVPRASDVRINEIDLSHIVASSSSSTVAQIIVSTQGETIPKRWTDPNLYKNHYGNPNAKVSFDIHCALDFFREGNDLWGLRVVGAGAMYSAAVMYNTIAGVTNIDPIPAGVEDPENEDLDALRPADAVLALFYPNKGQGSYGQNIAVGITSQNIDAPTNLSGVSELSGGTLQPGTFEYQVSARGLNGETLASSPLQVVIAGAGTTHQITLSWDQIPQAVAYELYGRVAGSGYGHIATLGQTNFDRIEFVDTGLITPDTTKTPITDPQDLPPPLQEFILNVYDLQQSSSVPVEQFNCTLDDNTDDVGVATELESRINPFSEYIRVRSNVPALANPDAERVTNVVPAAFGGGDSGATPTSGDIIQAWKKFRNRELYEVQLLLNSGHTVPSIQHAMEELARTRNDSVAILDTPSVAQNFQQAINFRNIDLNLNSSYAALFNPDVYEIDEISGKELFVPFSGWATALCARTDRVANPSFSIAGLNRGLVNVLKARYTFDDGQASALFKAQVNYLRTFVGMGTALWEQKTLQAKDTALSWLSVRRISNVIKVSLYKFGLYILQEQNDDFTGRQLVRSFSDYLEAYKNVRALHSYTVVSDGSNNSEAMLNSGIRRGTVIIIPVIPIHELQIDFVISKQGVSFTETLRSLYGGA